MCGCYILGKSGTFQALSGSQNYSDNRMPAYRIIDWPVRLGRGRIL